ncbi:hypothetical protein [Ornithinimicrobium sp. LYQ103]|uniref:hypothetical protein n=1 Tax=Ornithinimicrobium sp. LYQ103 TaxID=3378796 RepID=UPI0038527206
MGLRQVIAASALAVVALAGCSADDGGADSETTAVDPPRPGPGPDWAEPVSDAAIDEFAAWYEAAVAGSGDELDARFSDDDEVARRDAYADLIQQLCGLQAGSPDRLRASATSIKEDPEFSGDEEFARAAILQARTACGLDG